ncbi:hypothetical protein [Bradyrhizobium sp. 192]|nr:hypothetical protein [Bradyrhizobium sp. 192]UPJ57280.1 hypothetical protein IVB24_32720 [Bradyrhizobium sp. 192]
MQGGGVQQQNRENNPMHSRDGVEKARENFGLAEAVCVVEAGQELGILGS